ncbi:MAG: ribonuclease HII [Candidatus Thermoplasmatota archaeon]
MIQEISGVDEAGRGPVIGPLIVAGVKFKNQDILEEIKVKDSKRLSPKNRTKLERIIKQKSDRYETLKIPAKDIDDMRKVMTMNEIEIHAFTKVIKKLKTNFCYVDSADANEKRFGNNIQKNLNKKIKIISEHKADDTYPIVSAASILAKTRRDKEVKKIEKNLQKKLKLPLGSGYPSDMITSKFLNTYIEKYKKLPPYTRRSWNTSKKALRKITEKTIDDF